MKLRFLNRIDVRLGLTIGCAVLLCACAPAAPVEIAGTGDLPVLKIEIDSSSPDPPDSDRVLTGPFFEKGVYSGSELSHPLGFNAQFFHQIGTHSFVAMRSDCQTVGEIHLTDLALYTLPDSVDVRAWMGYRFADFGNWADDIDPVRTPASRVEGRILDARDVVAADSVFLALSYRLRLSALFADGTALPVLETSELTCQPRGEYWPPPDIRQAA